MSLGTGGGIRGKKISRNIKTKLLLHFYLNSLKIIIGQLELVYLMEDGQ